MKIKRLIAVLLVAVMVFAVAAVPTSAAPVFPTLTATKNLKGRNSLASLENGEKYLKAYDRMMIALNGCKTSVNLSGLEIPLYDAQVVADACKLDGVHLTWWNGKVFHMTGTGEYADNVRFIYYSSMASTRVEMCGAIGRVANQFLVGITDNMSEYDRERLIHDRLVSKIQYDNTTENCDSVYGALIEGKANCVGYSYAFKYLANLAGLECEVVTGAAGGVGHMWNIITVSGDKYYCDVTWDDPIENDSAGNIIDSHGPLHPASYAYFNITTEQLKKTHTFECEEDFPVVTANKENFYVKNGGYLTELNNDQIAELVAKNYGYAELFLSTKEIEDGFFDYLNENIMDIAQRTGLSGQLSAGVYQIGNEGVLTIMPPDTIALRGIVFGNDNDTYRITVTDSDGFVIKDIVTNGQYSFTGVPNGTNTFKVESSSGIYIEKEIVVGAESVESLDVFVPGFGDVNGDGSFSLADFLRLKLVIAGKVTEYNGSAYGINSSNIADKLVEMKKQLMMM